MKFQNLFFFSGLAVGAWLGAVESTPVNAPAEPATIPSVGQTARKAATAQGASQFQIDAETRIVLRSISERYEKLRKWEANFKQDTYSVGLGKGTYNEGRFIFVAPNRFRYSIVRPENSDFISDGKKAWYVNYREGRGKPAYVKVFESLGDTDIDRYLILLRGINAKTKAAEKKLIQDFVVVGKAKGVELSLELKPRKSSEIAKVELLFKNDQPAPHMAKITDTIGNTTTITVVSWRRVDIVAAKDFIPDYPKGSTVE